MQIKKIYNNNIAMVKNEAGDEVILVGKGIVFGLKKGDEIQAEKAEKKFELKGEAKHKFEKMIQDTPIDYILVSEEIIAYFKEHSTKALNDGIYVTLTDHIANTIERIRMGIDFDMTMLLNVKSLYREEYKLALHAIEMLRNAFHLHIDDNEANFITLHIVNAELTSNMMEIYTITSILKASIQLCCRASKSMYRIIMILTGSSSIARFFCAAHCQMRKARLCTNQTAKSGNLFR